MIEKQIKLPIFLKLVMKWYKRYYPPNIRHFHQTMNPYAPF